MNGSAPPRAPRTTGIAALRTLLPYLHRYRAAVAWGLLLVVVANAFTLATPYLIQLGIDTLGRPDVERATIGRYALLLVASALLSGAARYGMRELLNSVSRRVEYDLRNDLFAHLLRLDAPFYGRTSTGEIMSRATNDIAAVRMAAGPAYMYGVNTVVMSIFAITLMALISPRLTVLALLPMLALPPVTIGFGGAIHTRFERIQQQFGVLSTMAQENLAGVRMVKAYGQETAQAERMRQLSEEYLERNLELARVSGLFQPMLTLLAGLGMVLVLGLGGRAVLLGQITTGEFVAFGLYLAMLTWPMIALGWVVNLFQRGAASMGRINEILAAEPRVRDVPAPSAPAPTPRGELEFRGVSFQYPGTGRMVLRDIDIRIPAGATLAIVGPTGAGKSTLISLLARLYDPTEGEILLDGIPLPEIPLAELRAAIGVVPQDAFLFSETIGENLALGFEEPDPERTLARVRAAARIAQLDETVMALPARYDTLLGERGINLSGGQKQRATLARAIARDPAVLVLDDSLSAVDTHTEWEILQALRAVLAGRTSILVSHRVSAVMSADRIVVLEDGRIVEQGTHAELLERRGTYATLLRRQLLEENLQGTAELAPPADSA